MQCQCLFELVCICVNNAREVICVYMNVWIAYFEQVLTMFCEYL